MKHLPEEKLATLKEELVTELSELTKELNAIGRQKPGNPSDWEAEAPSDDVQPGDLNEAADKIEGYEENTAILKELEVRYNNVKRALERLDNDTYGICSICKEPIELERLEANPAAATCIAHKEDPTA